MPLLHYFIYVALYHAKGITKQCPDPDPKKGGGAQSSRPLDKWGGQVSPRAPSLDLPLRKQPAETAVSPRSSPPSPLRWQNAPSGAE